MNYKHLFWIIPLCIFLGVILSSPNLWNKPIAWTPISIDDICNDKVERATGIDLYNCDSGEIYLDLAIVKEVKHKPLRKHCFFGEVQE